ncbi:MAG: TetR-like C-terminal domain-containing protein [Acidimicrobiales bacterium]
MDRVLAAYGLSGHEATAAGRSLRAALHGFVTLESADSLGRGRRDESFHYLVGLFVQGVSAGRSIEADPQGRPASFVRHLRSHA